MNKKNQKLDIIDRVLEACYKAKPDALFILSLMHQYEERGSLSKKQLQGLYQKAADVPDMPLNWLATLEATILKMYTKDKTKAPLAVAVDEKDETPGKLIEEILSKYPKHKRVLFLQSKYANNEVVTPAEITELEKFKKLLLANSK